MNGAPLTHEDYASVRTAMQTLSSRYGSAWTLSEALTRWGQVVTDIEEGFDTQWVWEYHNDLACRDRLHEAWPLLTTRVRELRRPALDELNSRFIAATLPSAAPRERGGRWWHDRYPRVVTGEPGEELPAEWSPAPTYMEAD